MSQETILEAAKMAALSLKDWGCWESVVQRANAYFDVANGCGWVRSGDWKGKDEFPFLWAFDEKNIRTKHEDEMLGLQLALKRELCDWVERLEIFSARADDRSKLPPRKRFRETSTKSSPAPKLMMKFSPNKVQRVVVSEEEENTAIFV